MAAPPKVATQSLPSLVVVMFGYPLAHSSDKKPSARPKFRVIDRVLLFALPTSQTGGSDASDASRSTGNPQVLLDRLDLSPVEGCDSHQLAVFQTAHSHNPHLNVEIPQWAFSRKVHPSMILRAKGCHEFVAIEPVNAAVGRHPDHSAAVLEDVGDDPCWTIRRQ